MKKNFRRISAACLAAALLAVAAPSFAAHNRVVVTIENLAPEQGTFHTPFWIGFHNGTFDLFDEGAAADLYFPSALERVAEDGIFDDLTSEFQVGWPLGTDDVVLSDEDVFAPGTVVQRTYLISPTDPEQRYFSFASMLLPSNDFFIGNDSPTAHPLFDVDGNLVASSILVRGRDVYDAGTELNDEIPANTAFFGQQAPDTGTPENGVVTQFPDAPEYLPVGSGGILDDPLFQEATFHTGGYGTTKFTFRAALAITEAATYRAQMSGDNQVPPVTTPAIGRSQFTLEDEGTTLSFTLQFRNLVNAVGMHLHLGAPGSNGPIVALLSDARPPGGGPVQNLNGEIVTGELMGPLLSQPLDALISEINAGNVYINIHTDDGIDPPNTGPGDFPGGEIRGQLALVVTQ